MTRIHENTQMEMEGGVFLPGMILLAIPAGCQRVLGFSKHSKGNEGGFEGILSPG